MRRSPIRVAEPVLDGNERAYVLDCLDTTWISSRGKYIEQFESMVAEFCGVPYAIATNNGTTALHLALAGLGIQPGDEVIVPTLTYIASVNAVRYCGATPVLVDCVAPSMTVDPQRVADRITKRTRAIVTVPLFGHPVAHDELQALARQHDLHLVEDAAEALGATYHSRRIGGLSDCTAFSFFGNKIITTGEGGMLVTPHEDLAKRLRFLRGQAVSPERNYWHTDIGYNYRMTNVAAAIGCAQFERISAHLGRRQQVARWYAEALHAHRDWFLLPEAAPGCHHCYWMYSIILQDRVPAVRDHIIAQLAQQGIETRPVFYPVHLMPPYQEPVGSYPIAEHLASRGISLPTHGRLTQDDVAYVCQSLVTIVGEILKSTQSTPRRQAA